MSRSYIKFQGRGFWVGDWSLQIWLGLVVTITRDWDVPEWFEDIQSRWWMESCVGPCGCVDPELARCVRDETRSFLLQVCDATIEFLQKHPDGLDPDWLSDQGIAAEEYSSPLHIDPILKTGRAFRAMIAGDPGPFGNSPQTSPRVDF